MFRGLGASVFQGDEEGQGCDGLGGRACQRQNTGLGRMVTGLGRKVTGPGCKVMGVGRKVLGLGRKVTGLGRHPPGRRKSAHEHAEGVAGYF